MNTTSVTIASQLNDKVLRADWPKMSDYAFEHAIRMAAFVARAMSPDPVEDEPTPRKQKQYYISFKAMRRVVPRNVLLDLTVVGVKTMDFMNVITEASGLSVVHVNEGLWFFDMRGRHAHNGGFPHRELAKHYAAIGDDATIPQFTHNVADEDEDEEGW